MKFNSANRILIISIIVTVLALAGIFAPRILGIDDQRWAVTLSDICFFITLAGLLIIIVFMGRSRVVDTMLKEKLLLAHWKYTSHEWDEFTENQWSVEKREKKLLFYITAGFIVVVGGLFFIMTVENAFVVLLFGLAIIGITGFLSWFTAWNYYQENKKYPGEVYFSENAVYISRRLHLWKGLGAKLESIKLIRKSDKYTLEIYYTSPVRFGLQNYPVIVPIPSDKVKEAKSMLEKLGFETKVNPDKKD